MAEAKEIKVNEEAFNNAISKLTEYKDNLVTTRIALIKSMLA